MKGLAVDLVILNEQAPLLRPGAPGLARGAACARASRAATRTASDARGNVFILRQDLLSPDDRDRAPGGRPGRPPEPHGTLAEQLARPSRRRSPAAAAAAPRARPRGRPRTSPPPRLELEFFNGLGGFADDGREYVTVLGRGAVDARALDQRRRQPRLRLPGLRVGRRLHLVGQQPREPADALVQRSGQRPARRGRSTSATRRPASSGRPTALPDPRGRVALRRPPRPGLQPLRAHSPRHRARARSCSCRPTTRSRSPPDASRNRAGRPRRLSVTAYVEWVLGASRGATAPFVVTEIDPETGALLARNPWNTEFADRVAFADLGGPPDRVDRRPDRVPGPQRHARPARRRSSAEPAVRAASAPGSTPAPRSRPRSTLPPGEARRVVFLLGQAATSAEARAPARALPRPADLDDGPRRGRATRWDDVARRRPGEDARPRRWT